MATSRRRRELLRVLPLVALLSACEGVATTSDRLLAISDAPSSWEQVFSGQEVALNFYEGERPIQRLGRVVISDSAELIVPDVRANRLLVLDTLGERRRVVALPVPPSPVEMPSAVVVDQQDVVHSYVPAKGKIVVFDIATKRVVREVHVEGPVTDLIPTANSGYFLYNPSNPDGVVRLVDQNGRVIRAVLPIADDGVRVFHGRTQNGGMVAVGDTAIAVIEPGHYAVHRFESALRRGVSFYGDSSSASSFRARALPADLSPSDLKKAHAVWWDSFRHPDRPFVLQDSLLLISDYSSRGLWESMFKVSIVTSRGEIIADGLEVPNGGRVIGVRGRTVIVGVSPRVIGTSDSLSAYRLFRYTFSWPRK